MVSVSDLRGWSLLPGLLQNRCLAEVQSMLDQREGHSGDAAEVTFIVYDAERSAVNMDVRIILAPTTVEVELLCPSKK